MDYKQYKSTMLHNGYDYSSFVHLLDIELYKIFHRNETPSSLTITDYMSKAQNRLYLLENQEQFLMNSSLHHQNQTS
ncbi:hypothetical protein GJ496_010336 [Pomphorhynchus laevis]|nr:hypothetical protein GJ496_010336 [Pomphorhynchus laevis]